MCLRSGTSVGVRGRRPGNYATYKIFANEVCSLIGDLPEAHAPVLGEVQKGRPGGPAREVAHWCRSGLDSGQAG